MTLHRIRLVLFVAFVVFAGSGLHNAVTNWREIDAAAATEGYSRLASFQTLGWSYYIGSDDALPAVMIPYMLAVASLFGFACTWAVMRKMLAIAVPCALLLVAIIFFTVKAKGATLDNGWRPAPASSAGDDSWMRYGPGGALGPFTPACPAAGGVELRWFYLLHGHRIPMWVGNNWPERWHSRQYDAAGHDIWSPVAAATWLPCADTRWTSR